MRMSRRAPPGHTLQELRHGPVDKAEAAWLELPSDKREIARARAQILDEYLALDRRGADDAMRASEKLGVNRAMFFRLLKRWREERALIALVPHARTTRKPSIGTAVDASTAAAIVSRVVGTSSERSPAKIVAAVLQNMLRDDPGPARETIRQLVQSELAKPAHGFGLLAAPGPNDTVETARRHGEVLVIDHTTPKELFVVSGQDTVRPTLTFAVDLLTTTVVGLHLSLEAPGPAQVIAALADAVRATRGNRGDGGAIRPRLMMNADWNPAWRRLQVDLEAVSAGLTVRRTPRLNHGLSIQRLVGRRLGRLILSPRKSHDPTRGRDDFDPACHAPMTTEEATEVIRANALLHATDLLTAEPSAITLDLSMIKG